LLPQEYTNTEERITDRTTIERNTDEGRAFRFMAALSVES